jgi:hypothetical protein
MADDTIAVDMSPLQDVKIQSSAPSTNDSGELLSLSIPGTR